MAISNYSDLKGQITVWMARSDLSGSAENFIILAEARLNRELDAVEVSSTLTGTIGSRQIDITSLSMAEPKSLFITDPVTGNEREIVQKAVGTVAFSDESGAPQFWGINGNNIEFERELDQPYSFRFRHTQRFALSDAAPTNWLLTNHPDVYLAASLIWSGLFMQDSEFAAPFLPALTTGIEQVGNQIAESKRGELTANPALAAIGRRHYGEFYS